MRSILLTSAAFAIISSTAYAGNGLAVPLDEVRVVAFTRPVATLYVGNPLVADITIIDSRHAFVQGKAFGSTNVVALDGNGHQIANQQIVVSGKGNSVVTLQRGTQQSTYACAGSRCQPAPQPGDGKDAFESGTEQVTKYQGLLSKAATTGNQ